MRPMMLLASLALAAAPAFAADAVEEFETLVPGEAGSVELAYEITPSGFVENCTVRRSSGFRQLDDASCKMMVLKARFAPPAARTRTTQTIRWVEGAHAKPAAPPKDNHPFAGGEGTPNDWAALNPNWGGR